MNYYLFLFRKHMGLYNSFLKKRSFCDNCNCVLDFSHVSINSSIPCHDEMSLRGLNLLRIFTFYFNSFFLFAEDILN